MGPVLVLTQCLGVVVDASKVEVGAHAAKSLVAWHGAQAVVPLALLDAEVVWLVGLKGGGRAAGGVGGHGGSWGGHCDLLVLVVLIDGCNLIGWLVDCFCFAFEARLCLCVCLFEALLALLVVVVMI